MCVHVYWEVSGSHLTPIQTLVDWVAYKLQEGCYWMRMPQNQLQVRTTRHAGPDWDGNVHIPVMTTWPVVFERVKTDVGCGSSTEQDKCVLSFIFNRGLGEKLLIKFGTCYKQKSICLHTSHRELLDACVRPLMLVNEGAVAEAVKLLNVEFLHLSDCNSRTTHERNTKLGIHSEMDPHYWWTLSVMCIYCISTSDYSWWLIIDHLL